MDHNAPATGPSAAPSHGEIIEMIHEDIRFDKDHIAEILDDMSDADRIDLMKIYFEWKDLGGHSFLRYEQKYKTAVSLGNLSEQNKLKRPHRNPEVPPEEVKKIKQLREDLICFLLKRSVDYKNPEDKTKAGKKTDTFKGLADSENSNIKPVRDQVEEVIYGKDGDKGLEGIRQRIFKSKENGEDVTPTKHELNFIYNKAIPTLQSAIKNGMDEDNPDTKKYLEKWISTAHLIDRIDPKRSQNWHNYQKNPKGILDTPARLVLGGIAAGLAITAIVMVISRKLNGKEITGMDMAITAGYTAAAAVALGFWPKGQETQLEQIAQTDMRMRSRPMAPFRGLYKNKTITRDQGMEATQEFHDLLSDMSKNEKNELRSSFENGNVLQQLEELGISKDSNLYTVFKKLQTPQQQGIFANSLLTLDVHDSKKIETIKRSIQYIDIT